MEKQFWLEGEVAVYLCKKGQWPMGLDQSLD